MCGQDAVQMCRIWVTGVPAEGGLALEMLIQADTGVGIPSLIRLYKFFKF
jgi:hypothetical protein